MTTWLTESEFLQSGALATGVTLNVAFLQEIKEDNVKLKEVLSSTVAEFAKPTAIEPRIAVEKLVNLQDELKTHFALEEFYGYFKNAPLTNPAIGVKAEKAQAEHHDLFLQLNSIIELAEQVLYRESSTVTINDVTTSFHEFCRSLDRHEQAEMELMMRLCNEEIGVGD